MGMPEGIDKPPGHDLLQPFPLLGQKTAFARFQPAFAVILADADIAILGGDVHIPHNRQ